MFFLQPLEASGAADLRTGGAEGSRQHRAGQGCGLPCCTLTSSGGHAQREQAAAHLTSTALRFKSCLPLLPTHPRGLIHSKSDKPMLSAGLPSATAVLLAHVPANTSSRRPDELWERAPRPTAVWERPCRGRGALGPVPTQPWAYGLASWGLPLPCCVLGRWGAVTTSSTNGVQRCSSCTCLGLTQVCRGRMRPHVRRSPCASTEPGR